MTKTTRRLTDLPDLIVEENQLFEADLSTTDLTQLHRLLGGALQIRGRGMVVAHRVGHVVLPSGRILRIRSTKAPAASVLAWSAYVDPLLGDLQVLGDMERASQESDVALLVARLFLGELTRAIARDGLTRTYRKTPTVSATVRGRIDFSKLAHRGGDASRIACEVWERRPHSPAMRLLAASVQALAADPVMRAAAPDLLRSIRVAFADVPPGVDPLLLAGRTELGRNEHGFASSVVLARLVLRHVGLGEGAQSDGVAYLVGLDALFERAVVRALQEGGIQSHPKKQLRHHRIADGGPAAMGLSVMELDAFCPQLALGGVVVDAKYKDSVSSSNLQQMLAYCALTGARQAVLVVPNGLISDARSYCFDIRQSIPVTIHVVEFDVTGADVASWRRSANVFARRIRSACGASARQEWLEVS